MTPKLAAVHWHPAFRIIRTIYPPVFLFEDIADPADWDLIASAEAKMNPRVRDEIGDLRLVPVERRISGATASIVMGAFTHISTRRPSRFSDGSYGVWYCGDRFEVALMETAHHFERFMRRTNEPTGEAQFRELVFNIETRLHDLRGKPYAPCRDPDDWTPSQALGHSLRDKGSNGVLYPSVRWPQGLAAGLFWPDQVKLPVTQARHFRYHWNGNRMSRYFVYGEDQWYEMPG